MNEVIGLLPEIATIVGAGFGQITGRIAEDHALKTNESIIDNYGPIEGMPTPEAVPRSIGHRVGDLALRKTGVIAFAVFGGLAPIAWMNNQAPNNFHKPTIELTIDDSAQTKYDGSAPRALIMDKALINDPKLIPQVVLARGGSYEEGSNLTPASFAKYHQSQYFPVGTVSTEEATNVAIGNASRAVVQVQSNSIGSGSKEAGAVLVVTDDNTIGPEASVINTAKLDKTKIYIANVGNQTDSTAQELRVIGTQTGGYYWDANKVTASTAKSIIHSITPAGESTQNSNNNDWQNWLKVLDVAAGLAAIGITARDAGVVFKSKKAKD